MTFEECFQMCVARREFICEYDRLRGTSFSATGINAMVDRACGRPTELERKELLDFVWHHVWIQAHVELMQEASAQASCNDTANSGTPAPDQEQ